MPNFVLRRAGSPSSMMLQVSNPLQAGRLIAVGQALWDWQQLPAGWMAAQPARQAAAQAAAADTDRGEEQDEHGPLWFRGCPKRQQEAAETSRCNRSHQLLLTSPETIAGPAWHG